MKTLKTVTAGLMTLTATAGLCFADGAHGSSFLQNTPGATAYEKLVNAFDAATPMTLSSLPTEESTYMWSCANVGSHSPNTPGDMDVPVQVHATIVTSAATPGYGPLLPGTPEIDKKIDFVVFLNPFQQPSNGDLVQSYEKNTPEVIATTPGYIYSADSGNGNRVTVELRTHDQMIFIKQAESNRDSDRTYYGYCWKNQ